MKHIDLREWFPSNATIYFAGDEHVGNSALITDGMAKMNRRVRGHKNGYLAEGGDSLEAIYVGDKRFNLDVHAGRNGAQARVNDQRDEFIEGRRNIQDRLLYVMMGNHEQILLNKYNVMDDIARALNTTNGGFLVKALFPGFRVLDWHGSGVVQSNARDAATREVNEGFSIMKKLVRLPGDDCDLMVMHHIHKMRIKAPAKMHLLLTDPKSKTLIQQYSVPTKIWIDKKRGIYRIPEEERWYVSSGSLLRGYIEEKTTYVETRGYRPSELGCIRVVVKDDKIYKIEKVILD